MTEQDKQSIRQQFHKSADIQADAIIQSLEMIDSQLPKDISSEQRAQMIQNIVEQSYKSVELSTQQLAEQMKKQSIKPEVNNG